MTKKELQEILKYSNPRELLVVTWNNLLKQLFCPFRVIVIKDVSELKKGEIYKVDAVMVTMDLKMVYLIEGQHYFYHHFDILLD